MRACSAVMPMLPALAVALVLAAPAGAQQPDAAPAPAAPTAQPRAKARRPPAVVPPIQVYDARIEAGDLRISGSVRKGGAVVVLDEDISVIADARGRFVFRLPYRPATCVAQLKSGEDEREAVVANCAPEGQPGPKGEPGPTGPQGVAGLPGAAGEVGPTGEPGAKGEPGLKGETGLKGEAGAKGEAGLPGAPGPAGPRGEAGAAGQAPASAPAPLRIVRAEACPAGGCSLACETGEVLVSATCLKGGAPTVDETGTTASCPGGASGMVGACARP